MGRCLLPVFWCKRVVLSVQTPLSGGSGERENVTAGNASLSLACLSFVLPEDRRLSPQPAVGSLDPWLAVDSAQCFLS